MSILSAVQLVSEKMGVTVKANNLTDQLNAMNDAIGAEHGINAEDAITNYARSMAQVTPLATGATVSVKEQSATIHGYTVSTLQSADTAISGNRISGKLYQCKEGALPEHWGPGYWLCLDFSSFPAGTSACLVGLKPSYGSGYGDVYADADHDYAFKIEDPKNQKIKVITVVGNQSITKTFDLTGIEFVPADEG